MAMAPTTFHFPFSEETMAMVASPPIPRGERSMHGHGTPSSLFPEEGGVCLGMTTLTSLSQKKEGVYGRGHSRPYLLCQNRDDEDEDKRGRDEDEEDGEIERKGRDEERESGR